MSEIIMMYISKILSFKFWKVLISTIIIIISSFIGWLGEVVHALLLLMVIDFILWLSRAYRDHKFSSGRLRWGLYKFILYSIAMISGNFTDILIFHKAMEYGFQNFIILYLGVWEMLSIIKHLHHYGVKFPAKLIKSLENFRDNEITIK